MEGKTIVKSLELENGYHLLGLDDDTVALVKVVSLSIQKEELLELLGEEDEPEAEATKKEKEKKKSAPVEEETDEAEDDSYTWDDLKEMDFEELEELCAEQNLDTDPTDFDEDENGDEEKLRRHIAKELGITPPKAKKKKK